jgi:outer membrane lipoprotein carrier protein
MAHAKFTAPRRRKNNAMRIPLAQLLLALGLLLGLQPVDAADSAGTRDAAATVERYLSNLSTWSADFSQTINDEAGKTLRSASGHLYLQRPGKFRWDYLKPVEQMVLADGKKLWFYDKDLQQANVRDLDAAVANTPATLLSGGAALGSQFEIKSLPAAEGLEWFQLVPKHPDTDFQAVRIGFAKGELVRMMLADKLNEVTSLRFSAAHRNVTLPADEFTFTPPPGVDVIGRDPP